MKSQSTTRSARPKKLLVLAGLGALITGAIVLDAAVFGASNRTGSRATNPASKVSWQPSFAAALAASKSSGKLVLVDFGAKWCGACRQMDEETYPDARVVAASRGFEMARVDVDEQPDIAARYGISSLPTTVWMRADGHAVVGVVGSLEPKDFLSAMGQATARANKQNTS